MITCQEKRTFVESCKLQVYSISLIQINISISFVGILNLDKCNEYMRTMLFRKVILLLVQTFKMQNWKNMCGVSDMKNWLLWSYDERVKKCLQYFIMCGNRAI